MILKMLGLALKFCLFLGGFEWISALIDRLFLVFDSVPSTAVSYT